MALVTVVALVASIWAAAPVDAHEGPGILTVETDEPTDTGHHYVVRLVWENDGHPAARDTTLTATAFAPDGAPQTPLPMTAVDDDGRFEATVALPDPGQWRVNFTSVTPVANVDVPAEVAPPSSTTTGADDPTDTEAASSSTEDDDSSSAPLVILAVVLLVALIAAAAVVLVRRRSRPTPDDA